MDRTTEQGFTDIELANQVQAWPLRCLHACGRGAGSAWECCKLPPVAHTHAAAVTQTRGREGCMQMHGNS